MVFRSNLQRKNLIDEALNIVQFIMGLSRSLGNAAQTLGWSIPLLLCMEGCGIIPRLILCFIRSYNDDSICKNCTKLYRRGECFWSDLILFVITKLWNLLTDSVLFSQQKHVELAYQMILKQKSIQLSTGQNSFWSIQDIGWVTDKEEIPLLSQFLKITETSSKDCRWLKLSS